MTRSLCLSLGLAATTLAAGVGACSPRGPSSAVYDGLPTWSPDGREIAFMRRFAPGHSDIFAVEVSSGRTRRLTKRAGSDGNPWWSPIGDRIAFCSDRDGQDEIYVMAPDGSSLTNLTRHPASDCPGAWSPDGSRLAFVSDRDGQPHVFIADLEGVEVTRLTDWPSFELLPAGAWSPDGTKLLLYSTGGPEYRREGPFDDFAIYEIEVGSTAEPRMIVDLPGEDSYASWSPDGEQILFRHREPMGTLRESQYDIYAADVDGSNATVLIGGLGHQYDPIVSPDNRFVAYHSSISGKGAIWVANRDGSERRQLTNF